MVNLRKDSNWVKINLTSFRCSKLLRWFAQKSTLKTYCEEAEFVNLENYHAKVSDMSERIIVKDNLEDFHSRASLKRFKTFLEGLNQHFFHSICFLWRNPTNKYLISFKAWDNKNWFFMQLAEKNSSKNFQFIYFFLNF